MADNILQFEWITTLKWGLDVLLKDRADVFVAGDHLIYAVEDEAVPGVAPDVYVAFGRPKGHRGSYKVWEESGIFPQVIFEVWSPGNRVQRMEDNRAFYERYGAEEFYTIYPEHRAFVDGWHRVGERFERIVDIASWVSPGTGIRFGLKRGHLTIIRPDGGRFLTYVEIHEEMTREKERAEEEKRRAEEEKHRADKLAAKLRELGLDPDAV
jgi:hypothetical protein